MTAFRTTFGGGLHPIISGSGDTATCTGFDLSALTERFMTNPPGAPWRIPSAGWMRDAAGHKDHRGFTITMRLIYEAAVQGASGNTSEFNGAGHQFPDLRVQTLTQAVDGIIPAAAEPEAFGVAF